MKRKRPPIQFQERPKKKLKFSSSKNKIPNSQWNRAPANKNGVFHWKRNTNTSKKSEFSIFSKKKIRVFTYSNEEYSKLIRPLDDQFFPEEWTKDQTDELFELCKKYDLRFPVIHDRLSFSKPIESIKKRYFLLAQKLLSFRAEQNMADVSKHPVYHGYKYESEVERKKQLQVFFERDIYQDQKENELMKKLYFIESKMKIITKKQKENDQAKRKNEKKIADVEIIPTELDRKLCEGSEMNSAMLRSEMCIKLKTQIRELLGPEGLEAFGLTDFFQENGIVYYSSKVQEMLIQILEKAVLFNEVRNRNTNKIVVKKSL